MDIQGRLYLTAKKGKSAWGLTRPSWHHFKPTRISTAKSGRWRSKTHQQKNWSSHYLVVTLRHPCYMSTLSKLKSLNCSFPTADVVIRGSDFFRSPALVCLLRETKYFLLLQVKLCTRCSLWQWFGRSSSHWFICLPSWMFRTQQPRSFLKQKRTGSIPGTLT